MKHRLVELVELIHASDEPNEEFDEELDALCKRYKIEIKFVDDYYREKVEVKPCPV